MKIFKFLMPAAILLMSAATPVPDTFTLNNNYKVTIHGTSNLHSWDEKVGTVSGSGTLKRDADGSYEVGAVNMKMAVHSIKSDMGPAMNNNTYKALKGDANPEITFALIDPIRGIRAGASATDMSAKCNLTIAGVTKPVVMQVKISMPQKDTMDMEGAQRIKMTDYGVTPPVALFGTLITGDEITIDFKVSFSIAAN